MFETAALFRREPSQGTPTVAARAPLPVIRFLE